MCPVCLQNHRSKLQHNEHHSRCILSQPSHVASFGVRFLKNACVRLELWRSAPPRGWHGGGLLLPRVRGTERGRRSSGCGVETWRPVGLRTGVLDRDGVVGAPAVQRGSLD